MRVWSLHPKYLDPTGLTACWRETLLARKVLAGDTRGYRNHPQLIRFKAAPNPLDAVEYYLLGVLTEAQNRGYRYDASKVRPLEEVARMPVTRGQLEYEWEHLMRKLSVRNPERYEMLRSVSTIEPHPLFEVCEGGIESWEVLG